MPPRVLRGLVSSALRQDEVDVVLAVVAPPLPGSTVDEALAAIAHAAGPAPEEPGAPEEGPADKPVVVVSVGSPSCVHDGLPRFRTVEEAVRAVAQVVAYAAWRRSPVGSVVALSAVDSAAGMAVAGRQGSAAELLAAYGVPIVPATTGVECVVEVVDDPSFGPVVGFGVGGIATELLGDRAWRVAPLTDVDASALVRAPRAAALLQGYRGAPAVALPALEDLLLRVGRLAYENPAVKRLTLDPLIADATGVSVVQASVEYGQPDPRPDTGARRLL
jgi:hypothetical protein